MKTIITLCIAMMMTCVSCVSSAKFGHQNLNINKEFDAISANSIICVEYSDSPTVSCKIDAPDDIIDDVVLEVKDSTLNIFLKNSFHRTINGTIKVTLASPRVHKFETSGNSTINVVTTTNVEHLKAEASGNSIISFLDVNCGQVDVEMQGNSHIQMVKLVCDEIEVDASGNSSFNLLTSANGNKIDVEISGNTSVNLNNIQFTDVEIDTSGNSSTTLNGKAAKVEYSASGNSLITAEQLQADGGCASSSGNAIIDCNVVRLEQATSGHSSITNKK